MLDAILTSIQSEAPMQDHPRIEAIAGQGLAGDRYATGKGFYTGVKVWDAHVTLIEREAFDHLATNDGVVFDPAELRRNLITRGVELESLIGKTFKIGDQAVFRGRKAWPPCMHLAKLSGRREILRCFASQGGIGADVVVGGQISVGDPILLLSE
jgi:MOSC domain-containing protein YiiM